MSSGDKFVQVKLSSFQFLRSSAAAAAAAAKISSAKSASRLLTIAACATACLVLVEELGGASFVARPTATATATNRRGSRPPPSAASPVISVDDGSTGAGSADSKKRSEEVVGLKSASLMSLIGGVNRLHLLSAGDAGGDGRTAQATVPVCPGNPPNLVGRIRVKRLKDTPSWDALEKTVGANLTPGGRYQPGNCTARQRVAIVIPFRDRTEHLRILLTYLHPFLQSQQLDYGIFVVEQTDAEPFNRAALLNVGFLEAGKIKDYDCFIFHDVDFIPINDHNLYKCMTEPVLLSAYGNRWKKRRPYRSFFGGVVAVSKQQMRLANGYSNGYWGWGAEDDDMAARLKSAGFRLGRRKSNIGQYLTLYHDKAERNNQRWNLLNSWESRMETDGLNSVNYTIDRVDVSSKLYTKFAVRFVRDPIERKETDARRKEAIVKETRNSDEEEGGTILEKNSL